VVLPQFTVTGNTTVTMHETAADSTLSPKPSTIRFSLNYTRASRSFPLSTATSTAWTFRSAPAPAAATPRRSPPRPGQR